ncbi:hypothetical protein BDR04DRAFT_1150863 [Suillus decipiens]|nr:hypothetical protein BDR04DRAFT_1150863 [Suillus decipiens]
MAPMKAPDKKSPKNGSGPPATWNANSSRSPMPQEDIEALPGAVTNTESTEKYLASVLLCQADEPLTLLHPNYTDGQAHSNFCHQCCAASKIADVVAELTAKHLSEALSSSIVNSVVAAIVPQVATVHSTAENLQDTLELSTRLHDSVEWEKEEKKNDFQITAEQIEEVLLQCLPGTQPIHTPMLQSTYSSITAVNLPPSFNKAVARALIQAKQILIDPMPGHSLYPPDATNAVIAK